MDYPGQAVGLGPAKDDAPFWIAAAKEDAKTSDSTVHIAFRAGKDGMVERFHGEAIKAGGKCNGKPGLRKEYGENYYAAFVLDPAG